MLLLFTHIESIRTQNYTTTSLSEYVCPLTAEEFPSTNTLSIYVYGMDLLWTEKCWPTLYIRVQCKNFVFVNTCGVGNVISVRVPEI